MKFSTQKDIVADAALLDLLARVTHLTGVETAWFQDLLEVRGRRKAWTAELQESLRKEWEQGGLLQRVRVRWTSAEDAECPMSLEISAGPHPYAGGMIASVDWRICQEWGDAEAELVVAQCRAWQVEWDALYLHAHLTDDHAVQNCADPGMLRLGFGVAADDVDPRRPGREISRGIFRYAACWLTGLGPALAEKCERAREEGEKAALEAPVEPASLGEGQWQYQLADRPALMDTVVSRDVQHALREYLCFDALAADEKWTMGFWQRD